MAKTEEKIILEREYIIPLRRAWLHAARYKRAEKAVKTIRKFLARHMKLYITEEEARKKIKIDKWLNEEIWFKGIRKPPAKIRVKARKYLNGEVKVELAELPARAKFIEVREKAKPAEKKPEEKIEKKAEKTEEEKQEEEKEKEKAEITKKEIKAVERKIERVDKMAEPKKPKKQMMRRMALKK